MDLASKGFKKAPRARYELVVSMKSRRSIARVVNRRKGDGAETELNKKGPEKQ
jgi:hypothetical protein